MGPLFVLRFSAFPVGLVAGASGCLGLGCSFMSVGSSLAGAGTQEPPLALHTKIYIKRKERGKHTPTARNSALCRMPRAC